MRDLYFNSLALVLVIVGTGFVLYQTNNTVNAQFNAIAKPLKVLVTHAKQRGCRLLSCESCSATQPITKPELPKPEQPKETPKETKEIKEISVKPTIEKPVTPAPPTISPTIKPLNIPTIPPAISPTPTLDKAPAPTITPSTAPPAIPPAIKPLNIPTVPPAAITKPSIAVTTAEPKISDTTPTPAPVPAPTVTPPPTTPATLPALSPSPKPAAALPPTIPPLGAPTSTPAPARPVLTVPKPELDLDLDTDSEISEFHKPEIPKATPPVVPPVTPSPIATPASTTMPSVSPPIIPSTSPQSQQDKDKPLPKAELTTPVIATPTSPAINPPPATKPLISPAPTSTTPAPSLIVPPTNSQSQQDKAAPTIPLAINKKDAVPAVFSRSNNSIPVLEATKNDNIDLTLSPFEQQCNSLGMDYKYCSIYVYSLDAPDGIALEGCYDTVICEAIGAT